MRLAFVVQRYGGEVAGGAESLCRQTALALAAAGDEVTVFTTTARDYLTWAPYFPAGVSWDGPVAVRRFPVEPADPDLAARLGRAISFGGGDDELERGWALAQGPVAPALLRDLASVGVRGEAVVLWTYLYATTQLALPLVANRAVLVPMAHDEPMLRFGLARAVMAAPAGLAFLTPEERSLVDERFGIDGRPEAVVGAGLDPGPPGDGVRVRSRLGLAGPFALYLGRLDRGKGLDELLAAHGGYRARGGALDLVLAGRAAGELRLPRWAQAPGFVDECTRADLLAACDVVVLPSPYESLSLVALEAWQAGRPTLATAASEVLAGQTARSGGGLLYTGPRTYAAQLDRLATDPALRERLGAAGAGYAATQTWPAAVRRWRALLAQVRQPIAGGHSPI